MVTQNYIQIEHLTLGYTGKKGLFKVIENANLKFSASELVGVVGLNGAGKSTLLKSLNASLSPIGGTVSIQGENIRNIPLTELAKKISIVLTERIKGFNLKVYDLVAAGQMPYTNSFHQLEEQHLKVIEEAIEACGLKNHQDKNLNELSDGLFQKAVLAKALAQQTPIMLLDEPSAYLDYASKHKLFLLLRQLCDEQLKCILVSSHDLDLLLKYCTKIVVISNKNVEQFNVADAKENPSFLEIADGFLTQ